MGTLYKNCRIITGTQKIIESGWFRVDNEKISRMGAMSEDHPDFSSNDVDLTGMTVMPGLIDCHVHLVMDGAPDPVSSLLTMDDSTATIRMMKNAWETLQAGVTTVRDLGCINHVGLKVRDAINAGSITGPRILCAGQMICMTGGHGWQVGIEADGPHEVRKAARRQIKANVDFIKLMATGGICTDGVMPGQTQYSLEEMKAGVEEAHKAGVKTAAHAQGLEGVKIALYAGIDTIEHGMDLDNEAIEMMFKNHVPLIPTLSAGAHIINHGKKAGIPSYIVEKSIHHRQQRLESCKKAFKAGVTIALGTDAGTPFNQHGKNAYELSELSALGLTSHEIILAATGLAAKSIGIHHITGTIDIGKQADFLVLKKNPLEDICCLQQKENFKDIRIGGKSVLNQINFLATQRPSK
jgi:imidazolonepropionase-like amidohydrolase